MQMKDALNSGGVNDNPSNRLGETYSLGEATPIITVEISLITSTSQPGIFEVQRARVQRSWLVESENHLILMGSA
ncbi:MAG: hypothetical protein CL936_16215 [Deltaproteobacteria bacterium]|nr:hypothetical protein [Deltaproteobacteria bacterium]